MDELNLKVNDLDDSLEIVRKVWYDDVGISFTSINDNIKNYVQRISSYYRSIDLAYNAVKSHYSHSNEDVKIDTLVRKVMGV